MDYMKRLSTVFNSSEEIIFDESSKLILMSDCHRGTGGWADTFSNNQNVYFAALNYYFQQNYTYIELGDGDELWENTDIKEIIREHSNVFWLLSEFYKKNRLYLLYGNHDMVKKDKEYVKTNLSSYFSERLNIKLPLFKNIKIHEGLILKDKKSGNKIFLVHGHQVDLLNSTLWIFARFIVRFFWKPLETFGVNDLTRTAKNYEKRYNVAKKLTKWAKKEKLMVIAGHNHRPAFPEPGESLYFNDGSCVHPRCITGIEICGGCISLVKWFVKISPAGYLKIGREILAGPEKISDYFCGNYSNKSLKINA